MERAVTALLRADRSLTEQDAVGLTVGDLPAGVPTTEALLRRRATLGLPLDAGAPVLVDADGRAGSGDRRAVPAQGTLRAHLDRLERALLPGGLLRTRYPGSGDDQAPRPDDALRRPLLPLLAASKGSCS